jgi:hypothetical protein
MPTNKNFKKRVRARMAKTGEPYTTARAAILASGDVDLRLRVDAHLHRACACGKVIMTAVSVDERIASGHGLAGCKGDLQ